MIKKFSYAAAAVIIVFSAISFSKTYTQAWLPLYKQVILSSYSRFEQAKLELGQHKTEHVIKLWLNNSKTLIVAGKTLPPNLQITSHTLMGHVTQHLIFYLMTLLAGSYYFTLRWQRFIPATLLGLLLLECLDIPFVFIGTVEGLILENFNPQALDSSWRVMWGDILLNGGRIGLAIALAGIVIAFSQNQKTFRHQ